MASRPVRDGRGRVPTPAKLTDHEGFLRHARFRWLKVAIVLALVSLAAYLAADVTSRPNGGTWIGYTLGTVGALLIVWLALLGVRKRAMTRGRWSLKAWTSAHVYLGLSLVVVATLHTGFQFGWNVHTLAYALMIVVIASGVYGISAYATLPASLSSNREEMTQGQMLDALAAIDRQLADAAQPLPQDEADMVRAVLEQSVFRQSLRSRLTGRYPRCATQVAVDAVRPTDPEHIRLEGLLAKRKALLDKVRRHLRLKGLLEIWLYIHVPLTFALLAALAAHIVSVFFYW
jgi:hypothetical protein